MRSLLKSFRFPAASCHRKLTSSPNLSFVPDHESATREEVHKLQQLMCASSSVLVLTGAGISTECGLPDYRSERVGLFARTNHKPITLQEFVSNRDRRKAYWARNFIAWPKFSVFEPGIAHETLSEWQKIGKVSRIITQNVDRLHQKAGSKDVIELHGNGFTVGCLNCSYTTSRQDFQAELTLLNADWLKEWEAKSAPLLAMRPDGDVQLEERDALSFQVASCPSCGGMLKPKVVFFGENIPKAVVEESCALTDDTDLLLVIGSSLHVFSGYRFVCRAQDQKKGIVIVNIGPTRADHMTDIVFLRRRAGDLLPRVSIS